MASRSCCARSTISCRRWARTICSPAAAASPGARSPAIRPADAENYDAYSAALNSVVGILRQWLLRAPPNAGGGLADILALLKLGAGVNRLSLEEQRHLLDFFTKSAADILDRYFSHDLVQALFGFDAVVGHYASPYAPGSAYVLLHHVFGEAAGVAGAWGHAIGGMGAITQAMAKACARGRRRDRPRYAGRRDHRRERPGGRRRRRRQGLAGQGGRRRRQSHACCSIDLLPEGAVARKSRGAWPDWASKSATFRMNVALSELPRFTSLPEPGDHLTAGIIIAPSLDYMDRA